MLPWIRVTHRDAPSYGAPSRDGARYAARPYQGALWYHGAPTKERRGTTARVTAHAHVRRAQHHGKEAVIVPLSGVPLPARGRRALN
jgi:hypothetical protein